MQVKPQIGLTFATALRHFLRQDPDVIMVGEIRDLETAQIAMQAALTGHLVLSTLHTESAAGAIVRLLDMGVEDYLIAATVSGIVAQRLVRLLCVACKEPDPDVTGDLGVASDDASHPCRPVGCSACRRTGFSGRIAIAEALVVDAAVREAISAHAGRDTLQALAVERGMVPMREVGLRLVRAGRTTAAEVQRAVREEFLKMPRFDYEAVMRDGRLVRGSMEAAHRDEALARLSGMSRTVISLTAPQGLFQGFGLERLRPSAGLNRVERMRLARELATLVQAGFELDQALHFAAETQRRAPAAALVRQLRAELREGASLTEALSRRPNLFDGFFVAMVRAGEASGQLGQALDQLALALERRQKLRSTMISALTYPALVCCVAAGSIAFLLTRVVPQFAPLIAQSGRPLPPALAVLLAVGENLSVYGPGAIVLLGLLCVGFRFALKRPTTRILFERFVFALPIAGDLLRASEAARFGRTLGSLLSRGGDLMGALPVAREVLTTLLAATVVTTARTHLSVGQTLSNALMGSQAFPPAFLHMAALGERTGKLGAMLLAAAETQDLAVQETSGRLVALLTPIVTLLIGGAVAAIVSTIVTAMIGLNDVVL